MEEHPLYEGYFKADEIYLVAIETRFRTKDFDPDWNFQLSKPRGVTLNAETAGPLLDLLTRRARGEFFEEFEGAEQWNKDGDADAVVVAYANSIRDYEMRPDGLWVRETPNGIVARLEYVAPEGEEWSLEISYRGDYLVMWG